MRAFIAIAAPDENCQALHSCGNELKKYARINVPKPENIHLTLRFLGEISVEKAGEITGIMDDSTVAPFNIWITGLGAFPKPSNPRVVWAGVSEGADRICEINACLGVSLSSAGFEIEKRFHPHYTIGRVKETRDRQGLTKHIKENKGREFGSYQCNSIQLMKSELTPKGPVYEAIHESPLK